MSAAQHDVTLSLICRDNAATLPRLLDSLARERVVQRVVACDTGSADATVAVLEGYGVEPVHAEWCDDFSFARNQALQQAVPGSWVLSLDSDEWVAPGFGVALRSAIQTLEDAGRPEAGVAVQVASVSDSAGYANVLPIYAPRVFKNLPGTEWVFPVHEQTYRGGKPINFLPDHRLVVHHDGYLAAEMQLRGKAERNLRILTAAIISDPDQHWFRYNLGETLFSLSHYRRAEAEYSACLRLCREQGTPELAAAIYSQMRLVNCLFLRGQLTEAQKLGEDLAGRHPRYAEGLCALAQVLMARGDFYSAASLYEQAVEIGQLVWLGTQAYTYTGDESIRGWRGAVLQGRAYAYAKEYVRAIEVYEQSVQLGSPVADPLIESAACFAAVGRPDLAQLRLGEVLVTWPDDRRALAVRSLLEKEASAAAGLYSEIAAGGVDSVVGVSL